MWKSPTTCDLVSSGLGCETGGSGADEGRAGGCRLKSASNAKEGNRAPVTSKT